MDLVLSTVSMACEDCGWTQEVQPHVALAVGAIHSLAKKTHHVYVVKEKE